MEPVGELRSTDGEWVAVVYANPAGTFDVRLFQRNPADDSGWTLVPDAVECGASSQRHAISEARARYPQVADATYRIVTAEPPPEAAARSRSRGVLASVGVVFVLLGAAALYFGFLYPGTAAILMGSLMSGWSIGGFGSSGYGGSNS